MTLHYNFELDDSVAFNRHFMFKSAHGRRSVRRTLFYVFVLSFAILALPSLNELDWMYRLALASFGSVVACAVYLLTLPLLVRRTISSVHAGHGSTQPFGDRRLSLEPTGAREVSDHAETFATFESMSDPVETTTHVFIMINPLLGFVIPKSKVFSGIAHRILDCSEFSQTSHPERKQWPRLTPLTAWTEPLKTCARWLNFRLAMSDRAMRPTLCRALYKARRASPRMSDGFLDRPLNLCCF